MIFAVEVTILNIYDLITSTIKSIASKIIFKISLIDLLKVL